MSVPPSLPDVIESPAPATVAPEAADSTVNSPEDPRDLSAQASRKHATIARSVYGLLIAMTVLEATELHPLLMGAPLPLLVLLLSALGLISIRHAADLAEILAYATLLAFGWWMVRNLRPTARVIGGVIRVVIAFVLVSLKAAFH